MADEARITQQYVEVAGRPETISARVTQQYVEVAQWLGPSATTVGVDNSGTEAVLVGRATLGSALSAGTLGAYFQHRESGGSWSSTTEQTLTAEGNFYTKLTGLVAGTTYEYRSVVSFGGELFNGTTKSFTAADLVYSDGFSSGIQSDLIVSLTGLVLTKKAQWHVAGAKTAYDSSNTTLAVDRPDNVVAGDGVLIFLSGRAQTSITAPAGFTLIRYEGNTSSSLRPFVAAYYKIAGASEPATYSFTFGASSYAKRLTAGRVTGFLSVDQHNGTNTGSSTGSSLAIPGVTATGPGTLFAIVGSYGNATVTADAVMEQIFQYTADLHATSAAGKEEIVAGFTNTRTFALSTSLRCAGMMFNVLAGYLSLGTRTKPHALSGTFPGATISWTATTPTDTSISVHAQVQGETAITDEAVGTGDGTETEFVLDHWPVGTVTVKVDGTTETGFTQDVNDPRKITFTTAPADTLVITASYTGVDDPVELDWEAQTSGNTLTVPAASTNVDNKHLWIKQTLSTTDQEVTPTLTLMEVELVTDADTSISVHDTTTTEDIPTAEVETAAVVDLSINTYDSTTVSEDNTSTISDLYTSAYSQTAVEDSPAVLVSDPGVIEDVDISVYSEVTAAESTTATIDIPGVFVYTNISLLEDISAAAILAGISTTDEISTTESVSVASNLVGVSVSDDVTVSENVLALCSIPGISVQDEVVITEYAYSTVELGSIVTHEEISVTESVDLYFSTDVHITVVDEVSVEEHILSIVSIPEVSIFDITTVGEDVSLSFVVDIFQLISDSVVTEDVAEVVVSGLDVSVYDSTTVEETVRIAPDIKISVVDSTVVGDEVTTGVPLLQCSVYDTVTDSDRVDLFIPSGLQTVDSVVVSEEVSILIPTLLLSVADTVEIEESFQGVVSEIHLQVHQHIAVTDIPSTHLPVAKGLIVTIIEELVISAEVRGISASCIAEGMSPEVTTIG